MSAVSPRLAEIVQALPLRAGLRVLEIGCGPGVAARAVAERVGPSGFVLGIDRSAKAIAQAVAGSRDAIASGRLAFRQVAIPARTATTSPSPCAWARWTGAIPRQVFAPSVACARLW